MQDYHSTVRFNNFYSRRDNSGKIPDDMSNHSYQQTSRESTLSQQQSHPLHHHIGSNGSNSNIPSCDQYDNLLVMLDSQSNNTYPNYSYKALSNNEGTQLGGTEFSPNPVYASVSTSSLPVQSLNRRASMAINFPSNKYNNNSQSSSFSTFQPQKMYSLSSSGSFNNEFSRIPETVGEMDTNSSAASSFSHSIQPGSPITTTPETSPYPSKSHSSLHLYNPESKAKRSRNGCLTCRQRKKKCCERKPVCTECERLSICCRWPRAGLERKNRSKNNQFSHDLMEHNIYGTIKILRGVVDHKVEG